MNKISLYSFRNFLEKAKLKEGTFLILAAIIIGVLVGAAFLCFNWMIERLSDIFIGASTIHAVEHFKQLPRSYQFLLPLTGVFISGFIIRYICKESGGAGFGYLLKTLKLNNGIMPPILAVFKMITSALSIATGIPLGNEGPIVVIGSSIGSTIGQFISMPISRLKLLVGCGAAAGLAVAFNAPIAGTIFAVETILGNYAIGTLTPIVIAAASASFFGAYFMPGHTALPPEALGFSAEISSGTEIFLFTTFGLINALLGVGLIKLTYANSNIFDKVKAKLPEFIHIPLLLLPFALTVPFVPEIFGLGKDMMVAGNAFSPEFLIFIALLKLIFLSVAFASGASGGIFLPILFVGYIFGLGFGKIIPLIWPEIGSSIGLSFASVGIGALLGAATQEPVSSLLIVFEITRDYNMLPSLMLATVVATMISKRLSEFSIYNYQLYKEGISIDESEEVSLMNENHVQLCLRKECAIVHKNDELPKIIDKMRDMERFECYVVDDEGRYLGAINGVFGSDNKICYDEIGNIVLAEDLIDTEFPTVKLNTPLSQAMRFMIKREVIELPVLSDEGKVLGCIHEHDLIDFYHREILSKASMLKTVQHSEGAEQCSIEFEDEYRIATVNCPKSMWGHSLIDLRLRENFNVLVLAVRERSTGKGTMSPTKVLEAGDVLVAAGTKEDLDRMKAAFK